MSDELERLRGEVESRTATTEKLAALLRDQQSRADKAEREREKTGQDNRRLAGEKEAVVLAHDRLAAQLAALRGAGEKAMKLLDNPPGITFQELARLNVAAWKTLRDAIRAPPPAGEATAREGEASDAVFILSLVLSWLLNDDGLNAPPVHKEHPDHARYVECIESAEECLRLNRRAAPAPAPVTSAINGTCEHGRPRYWCSDCHHDARRRARKTEQADAIPAEQPQTPTPEEAMDTGAGKPPQPPAAEQPALVVCAFDGQPHPKDDHGWGVGEDDCLRPAPAKEEP